MRINITIFLIAFFYLASISISANLEQDAKIDSLKQVISSEVHDTIRLQAYYAWDNMIYFKNPDLDRELNFKMSTICAENLSKQIHPKEELFYKTYQSKIFNNLGLTFKSEGMLEEALKYQLKSLEIKQEIGDKKGTITSYSNIGTVYHIQGDLIKALTYYYESLKISDEINDLKGKSGAYNNIGAIYHYQKAYAEAIEFYTKSLNIRKEMGLEIKVAGSLSNIGLVYFEQGDSLESTGFLEQAHDKYNLALENHMEALNLFKKYNSVLNLGMIYNNIGIVYYKKGKLDIALDYFNLSYNLKEEQGNMAEMASALGNMANIYFDKGKFNQAKQLGTKAYELATESNSIVEINASSQLLYKTYKEIGQSDYALKFHESYLNSRDSLQNREKDKLTIQQQFKYEYDKKSTADSILQSEQLKVKNAEITAQNAQSEKDKIEIKRQKEQKLYLYSGLGLLILFGAFIFNRLRITSKQKKIIENQKTEVEKQKSKIEHQHFELEETHKEISDSIKYAQRLQSAILPEMDDLNKELKDGFVLFQPKDVVSGDFYWMEPTENGVLFAVADCTGHGVPGAMVSVVCSNALNRAVKEFKCTEPAKVLDKTKELVIETFEGSSEEIKDGMDIALCKLKFTTSGAELTFAGANNPLWILKADAEEFEEIKGSKQPIGKYETDNPFIQHKITLNKGDLVYTFSDGYADQFGGIKGKKFKYKPLKDSLIQIKNSSMNEQKEKLLVIFEEWKGEFEQVDDVTVIGVRIT